jgi:signal transduction histidine kinase
MASRSGIVRAFSRAFSMGADGPMDPRRAKRIVLSNQVSISIALLSLPFVLIYVFNGAGLMGWLEIPIFLGYASVHRLNKAGFTWFSRAGLITLANLDILIYTFSMGKSTAQHIFYFAGGIAPLVLFNAEEKKSIFYGVGLSAFLLVITEGFAPDIGLVDPVRADAAHWLRVVEMSTLAIVNTLLIVYFFRGNGATEMALEQAGEAAKAADRAKSLFLDKMSGEIRAPLNGILAQAHLLLKSGLGPQRRETVEDIQLSAQDLMIIVDEILDLSRIESGRMRLEPAPFSPVRLGHSVLRPFEFDSSRKGLELSLETAGDVSGHLNGDAARIKQILRNLIGNAFKFTESGKVVLRIGNQGSLALQDQGFQGRPAGPARDMQILSFEVEDTGIGVPEAARARIFEPFSQGDASTTRKFGGTGLGLFISKQIVEMMGGTIGLRPRPEGGTVFHFEIPLERLPEPAVPAPGSTPQATAQNQGSAATEVPPQSPAHAPPPISPSHKDMRPGAGDGALPESAKTLRILVVDDHPLNRKLLETILAGYGLNAYLAASAQEAMAACESTSYHLIFMDCHMPGTDGYECTRLMRQGPRIGSRPTIIGVTADAMDNNLRRCLDAGMDALLVKPIIEKKLRELIAECAARAGA